MEMSGLTVPVIAVVTGEGSSGGALALGLAQHGFSVMVIEHAQPAPFVADSQPDVRISAISAASVSLLKGLGVWDAVQAMRCHPYRRLETWEWETAHVVFDAADLSYRCLATWWKTLSCNRRCGRRWKRIRK